MPVGFPDFYGGLTLPVTVLEGGTGQTTLETNGVLIGQGTSGVAVVAPGSAGDVLQVPSGGGAPLFQPFDISLASLSGILPVANGGTGSDAPALVAGTSIGISGSWPNQTIANTSAYASLADPLPVAHGGTGLTAPSLVAGSNIVITGSWPDQTIRLATQPSLHVPANANLPTLGSIGDAAIALLDQTGTFGVLWGVSGAGRVWQQVQRIDANTAVYDLLLQPSGGNVAIGKGSASALLDVNGAISAVSLSLTTPLPVASGGTGAASLTSAGIWADAGYNDKISQTAALTNQSLVASATGRRYLISGQIHILNASGATLTVNLQVKFTYGGANYLEIIASGTLSSTGDLYFGGSSLFYPDSGTAIEWDTSVGGFGSGDSYDVHISALAQ